MTLQPRRWPKNGTFIDMIKFDNRSTCEEMVFSRLFEENEDVMEVKTFVKYSL